jgi:hypothetical protein
MKPITKSLLIKYHQLQKLRRTGKLNSAQQKELFNVCDVLFDKLLKDNEELLKRLKISDVTVYNTNLLKKEK